MPRCRLALVLVAVAVGVAACGSSAGSGSGNSSSASTKSASGGNLTAIRVAAPLDSPAIDLPVWIAQREGFFKKRGLNVQATIPNIPFSSMLASIGHQYDLVFTAQPDLIRAVASGIHDVAVFGAEMDTPQDPDPAVVMNPKSGVTSIKQLAGHSIGAPSLSGNHWDALECWLQKSGVKPSSVRGVQVTTSELPDLMRGGRVDGALIFNPILASLISNGDKLLGDAFDGCFGKNEPEGYFTATTAWANTNKTALAKFLAAEKEAVAFIVTHKSVARAVYAKLSGLPADVAAKAIIYPPEMNFKISAADFANWESVMKSIGQLPSSAPSPSKLVLPLPAAS